MLMLYPHGLAWLTCHHCCICLPGASVLHKSTSQSFALASGSQALANVVGVCSIIISTGDSINNNSAMAGGAMYSSDMTTIWINCSSSAKSSSQHSGCPAWSGNTVLQGAYGRGLAFPPSNMVVTPSSYTSNGSALMPLTIHVQDQAATSVSSGDKVLASLPSQQLVCA